MSGKKFLVITANQLAISAVPNTKSVLMKLDVGQWEQFLEHDLGIEMSATEARQIAQALTKMADAAEKKSRSD